MLSMSMECDSQILIVPLTLNNEVVAQYLTFQFQLLSYTYLSNSVGSTSYCFHNIFFHNIALLVGDTVSYFGLPWDLLAEIDFLV